jgi:hypothetical protein
VPAETNQAAAAREALRDRQYRLALTCTREGLRGYGDGQYDQLGIVTHLIAVPSYGNLAAAFEADDVLELMERAAALAVEREETLRERLKPDLLIEAHRQTLKAMKWLRHAVEQAGNIELATLDTRASEAGVAKVKSRLGWMEKVGTVHLDGDIVRAGRAPELPPEPTPFSEVPLFKAYFSSEADMDAAQLAFYRDFEARHLAGEEVDLAGQWSYAFALLSRIAARLGDDLPALRDAYERFEREYPNSPVASFCRTWRADVHFLLGDWQGGFDVLSPELPMGVYVTLAPIIDNARLQTATVEHWMTKSRMLTSSLSGQKDEVDAVLQDLLDAAHDDLSQSLVMDLWQRLIVERSDGAPGPLIAEEFGEFITQDEIDHNLEMFDRRIYDRPKEAFQGDPRVSRAIDWPVRFCATYWFDEIVRARIQSLYRDAENIVRRNAGMPAVGEGWISEVMLLRAVREAFPNHRVVHQGRPKWLGQQSLDIYLPDKNIGIEYQGAQHSGPVSLFGGQPSYERQVERDARKRDLCNANGCQLIEVHPGYDLDGVIAEIQEAIDR